ncbi:DNA-methyltransferase [Mesorhizobium sp. CA4]|uniref:DNA-methyltransferase n=1 Tax=Mesorhizobium sp. CA4 TaxID=588499 RepID=UPI001CD0732B|nr:site-specific DNA-methyltransferase [Mesorhizobium sp. CA4]MBZ9822318.1 site-specific DNA-methyltransferase [Mesorhizobium sp. CA4]
MKRAFLNGRVTLHIGDCIDVLRTMMADSVDCVVTSPPYWGLRDYGTATWEGGDPNCEHRSPTIRDGRSDTHQALAGSVSTNSAQLRLAHRTPCGKCGAIKVDRQIGLEPTLGEHLAVLVALFEEIRRVLKPTGTLWINYGDCYATSPNGRSAADTKATSNDDRTFRDKPFSTIGGVLKAKDLCMVPNRLAIALQEAGWWVRSEIVWAKPNPMPESIRDRPATSHEKIFMLTKSARYFYDAEAVRQASAVSSVGRWSQDLESQEGSHRANGGAKTNGTMKAVGAPRRKQEATAQSAAAVGGSSGRRMAGFNARWDASEQDQFRGNGRNLRNYEPAPAVVWNIATQPFSDAHFATFPPELAERCILAGCPKRGLVLDPFGGAGTTALVALRHHRRAALIELNPDYAEMAQRRIEQEWKVSKPVHAVPEWTGTLFANGAAE